MTDEKPPKLAEVEKLKIKKPVFRMLMGRDFIGLPADPNHSMVVMVSRVLGVSVHEVEVMPAGQYLWYANQLIKQMQPPKEWTK